MTSPERQQLRAAIDRHRDAAANLERTEAALGKLTDDLIGVRRPAVRAALDSLADSKRRHAAALIADALGEPPPEGLSVYGANKALAQAQGALDEAREARKLLTAEAERARAGFNLATQALERALAEVVAASPELEALWREYKTTRLRAYRRSSGR